MAWEEVSWDPIPGSYYPELWLEAEVDWGTLFQPLWNPPIYVLMGAQDSGNGTTPVDP